MAAPTLYVAITNHGFGHATRACAVAATVQAKLPDLKLIMTTTAPQWLLNCYLEGEYHYREKAFDIGVVQQDSLKMDLQVTLQRLQQIQVKAAKTIAAEAEFLQAAKVDLVLADIPPLAAPIAKAAGIPCWMLSNFGWDFIYRAWGPAFEPIADWIGECFGQCDRLFRLPFHEPMTAFPNVEAAGLTGGNPRFETETLRSQWHIHTPPERTILLTFGGLGLQQIPYEGLRHFSDWVFLTFDEHAPDLPNLRKIPKQGMRPVDVMPLCGRVVSKPGFSTFSEACRLDVPIVTLTREDFAEGPILVNGMCDHNAHQVLTPEAFYNSHWRFLKEPVNPPRTTIPLQKNGNEQIANAIVEYLLSELLPLT